MHFGSVLELSDINLWNIDLLDRHLDLLEMSWRRLQHVFSIALQDFFKMPLQDIFKTTWKA